MALYQMPLLVRSEDEYAPDETKPLSRRDLPVAQHIWSEYVWFQDNYDAMHWSYMKWLDFVCEEANFTDPELSEVDMYQAAVVMGRFANLQRILSDVGSVLRQEDLANKFTIAFLDGPQTLTSSDCYEAFAALRSRNRLALADDLRYVVHLCS